MIYYMIVLWKEGSTGIEVVVLLETKDSSLKQLIVLKKRLLFMEITRLEELSLNRNNQQILPTKYSWKRNSNYITCHVLSAHYGLFHPWGWRPR